MEKIKVAQERNLYLDVVKGIAIFLMVLGHCILNGSGKSTYLNQTFWADPVFKWIYTFHMPLFMLISGYFLYLSLDRSSWKVLLMRRISTLLVPIIIFNFYNYLFLYSQSYDQGFYIIFNTKLFWLNLVNGFWFLWAALIWSVVILLVNRFCNDHWIVYFAILVITFFIPNLVPYYQDVGGLQTYRINFMFPFIVIGYFSGKYSRSCLHHFTVASIQRRLLEKYMLLPIAGLLALFIMLYLFYQDNYYIYVSGYNPFETLKGNSFNEQMLINIYRFFIGVVGSAVILLLTYVFYGFTKKYQRIWGVLAYIGMNSLGLYILQEFVISFGIRAYSEELVPNYGINVLQTFFVLLVCTILLKTIQFFPLLRKIHFG